MPHIIAKLEAPNMISPMATKQKVRATRNTLRRGSSCAMPCRAQKAAAGAAMVLPTMMMKPCHRPLQMYCQPSPCHTPLQNHKKNSAM